MIWSVRGILILAVVLGVAMPALGPSARGDVTQEEVERAIRDGVRYLQQRQRDDGSWPDAQGEARTGVTSLVALALLTAGESPDSPAVSRALEYLRQFGPEDLNSTYAVSLQTMAFAAGNPKEDINRIARNVEWLERAQIKAGDRVGWAGSWTYSANKTRPGDSSNAQYALLGLHAASEVGVPVKDEVWTLARKYWEDCQRRDGGWPYTPDQSSAATASMTSAGISSLVITGLKRFQGQEVLVGETIRDCGKGGVNPQLERGINWMANRFRVGENFGLGQIWKYYYLYGLERAGRLAGIRFFGAHDWYREGAEELVHSQDRLSGFWKGTGFESELIATSFALLFLAKGRAPVLINKLRHGPGEDWNNDPDDVRNLVAAVSRDWEHLLTWQVVDPNLATVEDMLMAPVVFFNGHESPVFGEQGKRNLRAYVEQGGFLFGEACCGRQEFDRGFRALIQEIFPEPEYDLQPLPEDHPIWRARWDLSPSVHELWGIEHGCRTVVVYSPDDLSCFWNQEESQPNNPAVIKARRVGQNVIDYATGRELPADKLTVREVKDFAQETGRRGALHIGKLRHAGDWNIAPLAIPNLTTALRDQLGYDVVINHREILPGDPNLIYYPLIYVHGRAALSFADEDLDALRRHLNFGGTLFADAACGSAAFDAAFRRVVAALFPDNPMQPIPNDDELYSTAIGGYDLSRVQYSKAAGGGQDVPQLEGVQIDGRWVIIYSKYDIGCALERQQGLDCKGYDYESALKIATNIVIYSTLP